VKLITIEPADDVEEKVKYKSVLDILSMFRSNIKGCCKVIRSKRIDTVNHKSYYNETL